MAAGATGGYLLARADDEDGAGAASSEPTTTESGLPAGWALCTNERLGYAIGYPADWSAPALSAESECTFFDREPVQLPENSDAFDVALEVAPAQNSFESVVESLTDPRFEEVTAREELRIAGRPAVRVESRATGAGPLDAGTRSASYAVDRGSRPPLLLRAVAGGGGEPRLDLLEGAARSLVLFEPQQAGDDEAPPDVVARKRAAILAAAEAGDYDALAELADPAEFRYTFGEAVEGGPAANWRQEEQRSAGPSPAAALAAVLRMPYTLSGGIYVWPFAYDKTEDQLTSYERGLLDPLGEGGAFADGYLGWRAGIRPDGRWVFFVAGD